MVVVDWVCSFRVRGAGQGRAPYKCCVVCGAVGETPPRPRPPAVFIILILFSLERAKLFVEFGLFFSFGGDGGGGERNTDTKLVPIFIFIK